MKYFSLFLTIIVTNLTYLEATAQQSPFINCMCPTSIPLKKIGADLKDYYEVQICNREDKKIIGVEFGYFEAKSYEFANRIKVSVSPNSIKLVKIQIPGFKSYSEESLSSNEAGVTKIIYEDGSFREIIYNIICPRKI